MKRILHATLFGLLGAALGSAQTTIPTDPGKLATVEPRPRIESVEQTFALAPGDVTVTGQNLWLVTRARVAGVAVPFVHRAPGVIDLQLDPQDPGFFALELDHGRGMLADTIEFLPSLRAEATADRLYLTVNAAGTVQQPGLFVVRYSFQLLGTPTTYPGVYYVNMLDMFTGGVLVHGMSHGHPITYGFPAVPAAWAPLHFQAYHVTDSCWSFSNCVTVE